MIALTFMACLNFLNPTTLSGEDTGFFKENQSTEVRSVKEDPQHHIAPLRARARPGCAGAARAPRHGWEFRNHVLTPGSHRELGSANIERPKVIYNSSTGQ
ncbi:hypothetical protein WMF38_49735 [Sorangium sp. So ce118]